MERSPGIDVPPIRGLVLPTPLPPGADGHPRWEAVRDGQRLVLHEAPGRYKGRAARPFEARLAALVDLGPTPGLDPVLDGGVAGGRGWWTTPVPAPGPDLRPPVAVERVVAVAVDAATGLGRLHGAGLVHARVTPGALLPVETGARLAVGPVPPAAADVGPAGEAPAHVPPEVLEGRPWTPAGDVWALASTVYALLEGAPPFAAEAARGVADVLLAVTLGGRVAFLRPDVGDALRRAVERGLDADPERRPTASAFGALLVAATGAPLADRLDTVPPAPALAPGAGGPPGPLPDRADDDAPVGRPLGSAYLLTEPIGRGGMGRVWRGVRRTDGTAVAVKVLRPDLADDPEQVARFLTERQALRSVVDPHVVRVHDLVVEGTVMAIVMDLVEGGDLRSRLTPDARPAPDEAVRLVGGVAAGLAAVHRAGIVHRDVKPENVLLSGGDPPVRLTDFGVARVVDGPQLTRPTQLVGTPDYVAPELAAGRQPSPAADVYALGVLAYEVLTGRRPFVGPTPAAVLRAHLDEPPIPPPAIPSELWEIVERCLDKDPGRRPAAEAVAARLGELAPGLTGHPRLDPPPVPAPAPLPSEGDGHGPAPLAAPAVPAGPPADAVVLDGPAGPDDGRLATRAGRRPAEPPPPDTTGRRRRPALIAAAVVLAALLAVAGFWTAQRDTGTTTDDEATGTTGAMPEPLALRYVPLPVESVGTTREGRVAVRFTPAAGVDDDVELALQVQAVDSDPQDPEVLRSTRFDAVGGRGGASGEDDVVLTLDVDDDGVNDGVSFALDEGAPAACVWIFHPYQGTRPEPADLGLTAFAPDCTEIAP